ncbi:mechanosensitive ion channel family protein [Microlunatus soli]|uniref:mechanosensitive ion channel family protein n=1 Tax=Microlunatus soli TaxID=630515 RepID=UPI0012FA0D95|nr:mechanosensitive ion channel family protein [Microlunatus soli]
MKIPLAGLDLTLATVLWAVVAVIGTVIAGRVVYRLVLRIGHSVNGVADDLALQAARIARYLVLILGAGVLLAILGAPIQPVLAATLLVLASVYLVIRGIADNFGAGLVIQARHPVRLGDLVETCGYRGYVKGLNSRSVVLQTLDGRTAHLPNHAVMDSALVNYSASKQARSEIAVRIKRADLPSNGHVDDHLASATDIVLTATRSVRGVLDSPRPAVLLIAADPAELTVTLRIWHHPEGRSQTSSRVAAAVGTAFEERGGTVAVGWPPGPAAISISEEL